MTRWDRYPLLELRGFEISIVPFVGPLTLFFAGTLRRFRRRVRTHDCPVTVRTTIECRSVRLRTLNRRHRRQPYSQSQTYNLMTQSSSPPRGVGLDSLLTSHPRSVPVTLTRGGKAPCSRLPLNGLSVPKPSLLLIISKPTGTPDFRLTYTDLQG